MSRGADPKKWIEIVRECTYLPESELKQLCEIVSKSGIDMKCPLSTNLFRLRARPHCGFPTVNAIAGA
jgi:hypothetical protein